MKQDIILAGVGGQGILTIAAIIDLAAFENGLFVKQAEVHGMSQRGGAVQSHLRISSDIIYSDLIPKGDANIVLSVEPLEALRYINYLCPKGHLITSSKPFKNISNYPPEKELFQKINDIPNSLIIDAEGYARQLGNIKTSNMVMLGSALHFIQLPNQSIENSIKNFFKNKGKDVIELNLKALAAGQNAIYIN